VTVIQVAPLTDVHAQLDPVTTVMLPAPPVEATVALSGETVYVHCASAGRAWSTQTSANAMLQHRTNIGGPFGEIARTPS
jgi:hypothetical protein